MTDSERIAVLEKDVAQLQDTVRQLYEILQSTGGTNRAIHAAVFALTQHQAGPELSLQMQRTFLRAGASIVADSRDESHVAAFQDAEKALLLTSASVPAAPQG